MPLKAPCQARPSFWIAALCSLLEGRMTNQHACFVPYSSLPSCASCLCFTIVAPLLLSRHGHPSDPMCSTDSVIVKILFDGPPPAGFAITKTWLPGFVSGAVSTLGLLTLNFT